jgi:hypothetical protein
MLLSLHGLLHTSFAMFLHTSFFGGVWTELAAALWLQEFSEVLLRLSEFALNLGNNATFLILHEVGVLKTTRGLEGGAVPDLSARTFEHSILVTTDVVHTVILLSVSTNHIYIL